MWRPYVSDIGMISDTDVFSCISMLWEQNVSIWGIFSHTLGHFFSNVGSFPSPHRHLGWQVGVPNSVFQHSGVHCSRKGSSGARSRKFLLPFGSPGDPKIEPKLSQGLPKEAPGVLRRHLGKDIEKTVIFRPPWTVKMRLTLKRELSFHFSEGLPK